MATLAGHGIGAKIALAASCYHFDKVTGYIGIDSTPMNQYYHEGSKEIRNIVNFVKDLNTARAFPAISQEMKANILCPRWREIFLNNLVKGETGYQWNFNLNAIAKNLALDRPSNMLGWAKSIGLYPGRSTFIFPEYSRFVFQGTNTQPMHNVCPKLEEYLEGIYAIQGDDSPLSNFLLR